MKPPIFKTAQHVAQFITYTLIAAVILTIPAFLEAIFPEV